MAIVYDAASTHARTANPDVWAHTIGVGDYPFLRLHIGMRLDLTVSDATITGATYAGIAMTLLYSEVQTSGTQRLRHYCFYKTQPTVGANNISVALSGAPGGLNMGSVAVSHLGVDPVTPIAVSALRNATGAANLSVDVPAQTDQLVVDHLTEIAVGSGGVAVGAGQTERGRSGQGVGGAYVLAASSEEAGAILNTMSWTFAGATMGQLTAFPLNPYVGLRGRAVKYFFDLWDPKPSIKDVQGKVVPPDQLRADAWIELQGAKLPQSEVYDSFVEDPTKARIVEVSAAPEGATLKASRSQFADVLIKRAAAGRG